MLKKAALIVSIIFVFSMLLSACSSASVAPTEIPVAPATEAATDAPAVVTQAPAATEASAFALAINGKVDSQMGWTEDEVKAMTTLDVEATNKKGEKKSFIGVLISDLLNLAKPQSDATTVTFVADDGFTAEAPLADVMNCTDCIISFRSDGGFSSVLPAFESNLQVKGIVEIQVK